MGHKSLLHNYIQLKDALSILDRWLISQFVLTIVTILYLYFNILFSYYYW